MTFLANLGPSDKSDCKFKFINFCVYIIPIFRGCASNTKGTAYVIYEDIFDAKNACEHLSGFNVCNRYLVVLYYQPHKVRSHYPCTDRNY